MSKRFGRQQKRKMREQVKELHSHVGKLQRHLKNREESLDKLSTLAEDVRQVFGKHCALLPAEETGRSPGYLSEWAMLTPYQVACLYEPVDMARRAVSVMNFHMENGLDPLTLRNCIHIRIPYESGEFAYAVDQKTLKIMPVESIAREIAACIKGKLK